MDIIVENIRTFSGHHVIPLKPLTLLIGENSSGKTTLLGILAALFNRERFPLWPNFNRPPFDLGNYDTIATYKGGKFGRAKHFAIGFRRESSSEDELDEVKTTYVDYGGHAQPREIDAKRGSTFRFHVDLEYGNVPEIRGSYSLWHSQEEIKGKFHGPRVFGENRSLPLIALMMSSVDRSVDPKKADNLIKLAQHIWQLAPGDSLSIAPIRTRPERTYSQITETFKPTGDHIPFVLEQISRDDPNSKQKQRLTDALRKFGEESGLFTNCTPKHLGKKASDPFQLMVNIAGRARNLVDVGYGVSQALPIIVQSVLLQKDQALLLQQPEVHLHPRAQAALGSFFAQIASKRRQPLVIETHSDYIIDRVRTEVAAGAIEPDAVSIIYFHRQKLETTPFPMAVDKNGNLTNVPAVYRQFFLEEELNLFSRADKQ